MDLEPCRGLRHRTGREGGRRPSASTDPLPDSGWVCVGPSPIAAPPAPRVPSPGGWNGHSSIEPDVPPLASPRSGRAHRCRGPHGQYRDLLSTRHGRASASSRVLAGVGAGRVRRGGSWPWGVRGGRQGSGGAAVAEPGTTRDSRASRRPRRTSPPVGGTRCGRAEAREACTRCRSGPWPGDTSERTGTPSPGAPGADDAFSRASATRGAVVRRGLGARHPTGVHRSAPRPLGTRRGGGYRGSVKE